MAFATVHFHNPNTGQMREAPVGFSWTTLLFGCFPALFRSDWKWAIIMFLAACVTFSLSWLVFPFVYNKLYIADLAKQGYKVRSVVGADLQLIEVNVGRRLPRLAASADEPPSAGAWEGQA